MIHVEIEAGIVTALPAWMFDAGVCAAMRALGTPRVSTDGLHDLHRLLQVRGFRRSSSGDLPVTQEQQDVRTDQVPQETAPSGLTPRQKTIAFESGPTHGLTAAERMKAVKQLAQVLMLAAGIASKESDVER